MRLRAASAVLLVAFVAFVAFVAAATAAAGGGQAESPLCAGGVVDSSGAAEDACAFVDAAAHHGALSGRDQHEHLHEHQHGQQHEHEHKHDEQHEQQHQHEQKRRATQPQDASQHPTKRPAQQDAPAQQHPPLSTPSTWTELLWSQLQFGLGSQLVGGSLVLTLYGALMAGTLLLLAEVRHAIHQRIYVTVHVRPASEVATWIAHWLRHEKILARTSRFTATVAPGSDPRAPKISLVPLATRAVYKVLFGGQIVWVGVQADGEVASGALGFFYGSGARTSSSGGGELYGSSGGPAASAGQPTEGGYVLTALNWNGNGPETLQRLIVTAHELYERRTELPVDVFVSRYGSWERIGSRISRKMSSVILNGDQAAQIVADAREFLSEAAWYAEHGIPHRRGYLLHGPPGCGKTSFISALAGELRLPLCVLTISGGNLDGYTLMRLMNTAPETAIIVLEDIDAAAVARNESAADPGPAYPPASSGTDRAQDGHVVHTRMGEVRSRLTLSDLLNALDGMMAQEGRLLFMTTNHREQLDPALIRPGRVDVQHEFGRATREQIQKLFLHFYNALDTLPHKHANGGGVGGGTAASGRSLEAWARQFAAAIPPQTYSIATVQGFLIHHRRDPAGAVADVATLLATHPDASTALA